MKIAALFFLGAVRGAFGACVTLKHFSDDTCSGNKISEESFDMSTTKGSPCYNIGQYSVKDQYCDDGKFVQTAFLGPDCKGEGMHQVYDTDHCTYGMQGICTPAACPHGKNSSAQHGKKSSDAGVAQVILKQYTTDDCSDEGKEMQFPTSLKEGSACYSDPSGVYSVKDQYCDNGKFIQTAWMGSGCKGQGAKQVFEEGKCLYKMKLVSCGPAKSDNSEVIQV